MPRSVREAGLSTARQPRRRRSAAAEPSPADAAAINDLLDNLRRLRLTISADLAAAAGAVDANELRVARDILASDREELAQFSASLEQPPPPPPIPAPRRPRPLTAARRRTLLTLPAVPLVGALAMTAATAAGVGPIADRQQSARPTTSHPVAAALPRHHRVSVRMSATPAAAATTTLEQLAQVVHRDPSAAKVMTVARQLHHQIAVLITTAPDHPGRLSEVKQLLTTEQHLLTAQVTQVEAKALAASQRLAALLPGFPEPTHATQPPAAINTGHPTPAPATTPSHHATKQSHQPVVSHRHPRHQTSVATLTPTPGPTPGDLLNLHRLHDLGL